MHLSILSTCEVGILDRRIIPVVHRMRGRSVVFTTEPGLLHRCIEFKAILYSYMTFIPKSLL